MRFCRDMEGEQPMRALDNVQQYSMAQQQRQQDSFSMAQQRQDSFQSSQRQDMLSASSQQQKDNFQVGGPQRQELYSSTTKPANSYLTNSVSIRCYASRAESDKYWCFRKMCTLYALATYICNLLIRPHYYFSVTLSLYEHI